MHKCCSCSLASLLSFLYLFGIIFITATSRAPLHSKQGAKPRAMLLGAWSECRCGNSPSELQFKLRSLPVIVILVLELLKSSYLFRTFRSYRQEFRRRCRCTQSLVGSCWSINTTKFCDTTREEFTRLLNLKLEASCTTAAPNYSKLPPHHILIRWS